MNWYKQTQEIEPPIAAYKKLAEYLSFALPKNPSGTIRLWRGNRKDGDVGNPSYTSDLPGIALPFLRFYGGYLTYVDVLESDLPKYKSGAGTTDAEFFLPKDVVPKVVKVPQNLLDELWDKKS